MLDIEKYDVINNDVILFTTWIFIKIKIKLIILNNKKYL